MSGRSAYLAARALAAAAALCALGCATSHGRFDFDAGASFAAYRSFAFVQPEAPAGGVPLPTGDVASSELTGRRVRAALARELAAKGLAESPEESADLLVAFNVSSRPASRPEVYPDGVAQRWPHGWWHDHWDVVYTRIYTEGLLVVDLIDAKTRQLVWRGWTTDPLPRSGAYEGVVDHAVSQVMHSYPPAAR